MGIVYNWKDSNWQETNSPFNQTLPPEDQLDDAGFFGCIESGNTEEGIGIGVLSHRDGEKYLIELWAFGCLEAQLIVNSPQQLFKCLAEFMPLVNSDWSPVMPKESKVFS